MKFSEVISNRKQFAWNLILIALTTTLVISIVKSSLALSLGLVGALAIVRFRTAIKEPEELNYLFVSIASGLGMGANQVLITFIAVFLIGFLLFLKKKYISSVKSENLNLVISYDSNIEIEIDRIIEALNGSCELVNIKRFEKSNDLVELMAELKLKTNNSFLKLQSNISNINKNISIIFIDNDLL